MPLRHPALHYLLAVAPLAILLLALAQCWDSERALYQFFSNLRGAHPGLSSLVRVYTDWGNALLYPVYAAILFRGLLTRDRVLVSLALTYLVMQLLVALGLAQAIKFLLGVPRPDVGGLPTPFSLAAMHHSLPSGHTVEMTGAIAPLALWRGDARLSLGLGLLLAMMGLSRIYLGAHHVSDVAFGLLLGSLAGWAVHCFRRREDDA